MKKCPYCDGEIKDNVIKCVNCHKVLPGKQYTSKYRKLVQTVPDVMYELDTDGNFLFVSEAIKIFGYNPEDLIGKHFREMVHPDDFKKVDRMFILPKFKGKTTGDDKAPKLFDERRTKKRMTINMEVRILAKG
ncbi:MAG: PAS domain S-box protein, partial [Candidatus Omnitrophica bacterium]|nr:PAS domain S-box protein [Candidatus Omnitrophota bacterium]